MHCIQFLFLAVLLVENASTLIEPEGRLIPANIGLPEHGRIMATGHYSSERDLDLIVCSPERRELSLYRWSSKQKSYELANVPGIQIDGHVHGVYSADFDGDGLCDVLVLWQSDKEYSDSQPTNLSLFLQKKTNKIEFIDAKWDIPGAVGHPMLIDYSGRGRAELLGTAVQNDGHPSIWKAQIKDNKVIGLSLDSAPNEMCALSSPHFGAFTDFNGDGVADLLLQCADGRSLEIWTNNADGLAMGKRIRLPEDQPADGPLTVGDVDGDGAIDIVYYSSAGNSMNILFNQQRPFCPIGTSSIPNDPESCKDRHQLFQYDPKWGFSPTLLCITLPFKDMFGATDGGWFGKPRESRLLTRDSAKCPIMGLHLGDFDMDGYPDILLVVEDSDGKSTRPHLLRNTACTTSACGKELATRRFYRPIKHQGTDPLLKITDAENAAFLPFTPNTRLPDLLILRREGATTALRNSFFRDAFFLQVQVKSPSDQKRPLASIPGASFMYDFVDPDGNAQIRLSGQLYQSQFGSLPLPFIQVGLGRVSNFIEAGRLAVPFRDSSIGHSKNLAHLIPNSLLLAIPPNPDGKSPHWSIELYINPSEYLMWVGVAAASAVTVFAILAGAFKLREIREDNAEKRRSLHAINFDAL